MTDTLEPSWPPVHRLIDDETERLGPYPYPDPDDRAAVGFDVLGSPYPGRRYVANYFSKDRNEYYSEGITATSFKGAEIGAQQYLEALNENHPGLWGLNWLRPLAILPKSGPIPPPPGYDGPIY